MLGVEVVRFCVGTVARCVCWMALVLGALPVSFVVASLLTASMTGWSRPDPDGIIQGCETTISCAESATFWPVWVVSFGMYVAVGIVVALRLARRAHRERATGLANAPVPA